MKSVHTVPPNPSFDPDALRLASPALHADVLKP
jgi:hypothetical protein